ncbi:MAG TPA: UDP-glucose/GDP-mannose dehydrogenase family protein, partial [Treponema sp.]|nr:UDP-glucose/GDP-mannose dehydrogenase family protein [Treponema sp.]
AANERQKERMVNKIEDGLGGSGSLKGKKIAILGLAFKPNTDDMRESPAITICEGLVQRGAKLQAFDPAAIKEAQWRLAAIKDHITYTKDEYEALNGADALVLLTEWNQFRNLDLDLVRRLLKAPYFFDLRNVYKRQEVESKGFKYFAVGK